MSRDEFLAALRHGDDVAAVNWSPELERLHDEPTLDHWVDVRTRHAVLDAVDGHLRPGAVVVDLGCGSGHLLAELHARAPEAFLVGVDGVPEVLAKAQRRVPEATMIRADVTALPIGDATVDVAVSANLLEHVPDDERALAELARMLRSGGCAAFVVPAGRALVDYYDEALGHERRYGRGELARKARAAGLDVLAEHGLASFAYPAFWAVKKLCRLRPPRDGAASVGRAIESTRRSRLGALACELEARLGLRLPFGIRYLVVVAKP